MQKQFIQWPLINYSIKHVTTNGMLSYIVRFPVNRWIFSRDKDFDAAFENKHLKQNLLLR